MIIHVSILSYTRVFLITYSLYCSYIIPSSISIKFYKKFTNVYDISECGILSHQVFRNKAYNSECLQFRFFIEKLWYIFAAEMKKRWMFQARYYAHIDRRWIKSILTAKIDDWNQFLKFEDVFETKKLIVVSV